MTPTNSAETLARVNSKLLKLRDYVDERTGTRAEIRKEFAKAGKGIRNELAKFNAERMRSK